MQPHSNWYSLWQDIISKPCLPVAPRLGSGVEAAPVAWSPETCVATVEAAQRILIRADALIHSIHKQLHL